MVLVAVNHCGEGINWDLKGKQMLRADAAMIKEARAWFNEKDDGDANYSDQTGTRAISLHTSFSLAH